MSAAPRLRTELRVFAFCVIVVFLADYLGGGLQAIFPFPVDPNSPLQARLLPALALYALIGLGRWAASKLRGGDLTPRRQGRKEERKDDGEA